MSELSLAKQIEESFDALTERRAKEGRRIDKKWNHASNVGWVTDCQRHCCLKRLCPEKEEVTSLERQRVFDEGKIQEPAIRAELIEAGWEILDVPKEPFFVEQLRLTGEQDDLVSIGGKTIPAEYKSCSDGTFREIKRCEAATDLMKSRFIWVRHYPAQIYSYIFGLKAPAGVEIFKNKSSGEKKVIDVPPNPIFFKMMAEGLMDVNEAVKKEDPPRAVWKDDACPHCGFVRTVCFDDERIEDLSRLTNFQEGHEDLVLLFSTRQETLDAHKRYEKADKEIKRILGESSVTVAGEWLYKTIHFDVNGHDLPDDVKAEIEKLKEPYKRLIPRKRSTITWLKAPLKI